MVELATRNASGWTVTPVDLGYSEGYTRLVIDPTGRPMLSYTASNGWLRYAVRTGTTWAFETVDRTTVISRYIGLAVDGSGEPHISYYGNGVLRYAARVAGVWQTEMVDPSPYAGWYSTIGLDSGGAPHIAYYDSVNTTLRYAERVNGTWAISTIDGNDDGRRGRAAGPGAAAAKVNQRRRAERTRARYSFHCEAGACRRSANRHTSATSISGKNLLRLARRYPVRPST